MTEPRTTPIESDSQHQVLRLLDEALDLLPPVGGTSQMTERAALKLIDARAALLASVPRLKASLPDLNGCGA